MSSTVFGHDLGGALERPIMLATSVSALTSIQVELDKRNRDTEREREREREIARNVDESKESEIEMKN